MPIRRTWVSTPGRPSARHATDQHILYLNDWSDMKRAETVHVRLVSILMLDVTDQSFERIRSLSSLVYGTPFLLHETLR